MEAPVNRRTFLQAGAAVVVLSGADTPASASERAAQPSVKLTWLGGATMTVEFNDLMILTDPCFGEGEEAFIMGDPNEMFDLANGPNIKAHRRLTSFPGISLDAVDLVILSHAHEDHFDQKAEADFDPDIPMILPPHDVNKIAEKGFSNLDSLDWGQSRVIDAGAGKVKITAINAYHSENPQIARILGKGNGYWLEFSQRDWKQTIYWTGDTFGTPDVVRAVGEFGKPDLMVPHLGAVGASGSLGKISMGAEDLVPFVDAVAPGKVLAIHHSTYALYLEPIGQLALMNGDQHMSLDLVSEGTTVLYGGL